MNPLDLSPTARAVRLALKLAPWAIALALAAWLAIERAGRAQDEANHRAAIAGIEKRAAQNAAASAARVASASDAYAARAAALQPIIIRSKDTVTTYATTAAGRAVCLGSDRVRGIDDLDASLFDPAGAEGGEGAVPTGPDAAPGGR